MRVGLVLSVCCFAMSCGSDEQTPEEKASECFEHYCDNWCDKAMGCAVGVGYYFTADDSKQCVDECVDEAEWQAKDADPEDAIDICEDANDWVIAASCTEILSFLNP